MPKKRAAVGGIENQLSCNCVCLYQPWPWQNEEFPETLRKGLSHSQCHRRAGQEAEKERGEVRGVPRLRQEIGGWKGVGSKALTVTEEVFLHCLSERGGRGKLETWFSPSLAVLPSLCLCWKDEVLVWNVWVRRRRTGRVWWGRGKDILQPFSMG